MPFPICDYGKDDKMTIWPASDIHLPVLVRITNEIIINNSALIYIQCIIPTSQDQTLFSKILWGSSPRIYLGKNRQLLDQLNPLEFLSCYDWKAGINNTNAPSDLIAHRGNIFLERKYSLMGLATPYCSETVTPCISHSHQEKQPYEMGLQLGKQTDEPCAWVKCMLVTYYSVGNKQFFLS